MTATRAQIAKYLNGTAFARIYQAAPPLSREARRMPLPKQGDGLRLPVGVLAGDLQRELGAARGALLLSGYTLGKQKWEHPEIAPADYAVVQRILDGAQIYRQSETHQIGFAVDGDGNWWTAAWKRTRDGREVYLQNLRRTRRNALRHAARKYGAPIARDRKCHEKK